MKHKLCLVLMMLSYSLYGSAPESGASQIDQQLMEAIKDGDKDGVQKALKAGAHINMLIYDKSFNGSVIPLQAAIYRVILSGNTDMIDFLIDNGADVNAFQGKALYLALQHSLDASVIRRLLERGANPNIKFSTSIPAYEYPLFYAALNDRLDIVNLLLQYGANPGQENSAERTVLQELSIKRKNKSSIPVPGQKYDEIETILKDWSKRYRFGQERVTLQEIPLPSELVTLVGQYAGPMTLEEEQREGQAIIEASRYAKEYAALQEAITAAENMLVGNIDHAIARLKASDFYREYPEEATISDPWKRKDEEGFIRRVTLADLKKMRADTIKNHGGEYHSVKHPWEKTQKGLKKLVTLKELNDECDRLWLLIKKEHEEQVAADVKSRDTKKQAASGKVQ